jgi:hypothetical protein
MSKFVGVGLTPGRGARRGWHGGTGSQASQSAAEGRPAADLAAGATELEPAAALELARRAAGRALRWSEHADAARDIAADALVVLLERSISFAPRSIVAAAKHLARKHTLRPRPRELLDPERQLSGVDPSDGIQLSRDAGEPAIPALEPRIRAFFDGSTAQLEGDLCMADIPALRLRRSDGAVLCGHAALEGAQRLLLEERHRGASCHASNARRAVAALERDALLLCVAGLPWREAIARLAAQGIVVTRDGLRSGLRAARRRCMGLAAHDSRGSGRVTRSEAGGRAGDFVPVAAHRSGPAARLRVWD